ncbi:MAG: hypothetical protein KFW07_03150 [Mycoplasmataceae bacterium]|nr:hypothetical protein [Mycoplasmataceae bacterium]
MKKSKFIEIYPNFEIFKQEVIDIINIDLINPFYINDADFEYKQGNIYDQLIRFFGEERHIYNLDADFKLTFLYKYAESFLNFYTKINYEKSLGLSEIKIDFFKVINKSENSSKINSINKSNDVNSKVPNNKIFSDILDDLQINEAERNIAISDMESGAIDISYIEHKYKLYKMNITALFKNQITIFIDSLSFMFAKIGAEENPDYESKSTQFTTGEQVSEVPYLDFKLQQNIIDINKSLNSIIQRIVEFGVPDKIFEPISGTYKFINEFKANYFEGVLNTVFEEVIKLMALEIDKKQNTLIAGENIKIIGDTISSTGGGPLPDNLAYTDKDNQFTTNQSFNYNQIKDIADGVDGTDGANMNNIIQQSSDVDIKLALKADKDDSVNLTSAQVIGGGKTFNQNLTLNNGRQFIMNAVGNTPTFIEFKKDDVRIGNFGKGSSSNSDLTLHAVGKLTITSGSELKLSGTAITFDNKPLGNVGAGVNANDAINKSQFDLKQNKLIAGENIKIIGDTISSTGGVIPENIVTTDTNQNITGRKIFSNIVLFNEDLTSSISSVSDGLSLNGKNVNIQSSDNEIFINPRTHTTSIKPIRTTAIPTVDDDLTNKKYVDEKVGTPVTLDTTQTITGAKTFSGGINVGTATTGNNPIQKKVYDRDIALKVDKTNVDTFYKGVNCNIGSQTSAGDSTETLDSLFGAGTKDLIASGSEYYIRAFTDSVASRTRFPIPIIMENFLTSNDYNIHTGSFSGTFFNYTDYATTYTITLMLAVSRGSGAFRFPVLFNGTLNANFKVRRLEIWKKATL